jgi:hypothetical protein
MYTNLFIETIIFLFAILASSGIIYLFTIYHFKTKNFYENFSVLTKNSEKDIIPITLIIRSKTIKLTSLKSSASKTLSMTSYESKVYKTFSEISSKTIVSQDKFNSKLFINVNSIQTNLNFENFERIEGTSVPNLDVIEINTNELNTIIGEPIEENMIVDDINETFTSLDSITVLDRETHDR